MYTRSKAGVKHIYIYADIDHKYIVHTYYI